MEERGRKRESSLCVCERETEEESRVFEKQRRKKELEERKKKAKERKRERRKEETERPFQSFTLLQGLHSSSHPSLLCHLQSELTSLRNTGVISLSLSLSLSLSHTQRERHAHTHTDTHTHIHALSLRKPGLSLT